MSWTVLLMKLHGGARPVERFDEGDVRPLGTPTAVREMLSRALHSIRWPGDTSGYFAGDRFAIELNIHKGDPVTVVGLRAVGGGDALGTIVGLVTALDWVAYDASTGDFIDPSNPSRSGWAVYQSYRDRVVGRPTPEQ